MELLKNEPDFLSAKPCEASFIESSDIGPIHHRLPCGRRVEPA